MTQIAARDSGVGDADSWSGPEDDAPREVTNDPVTPPVANAGWATGARTITRRPFASSAA